MFYLTFVQRLQVFLFFSINLKYLFYIFLLNTFY